MHKQIISTWRSGSSFVGEVVASHSNMLYHFEPLLHFRQHQVRESNTKEAKEAVGIIRDLFRCDFSHMGGLEKKVPS